LIARVWHGATSKANKAAYLGYLKNTGMKEFSLSKGNVGAYLLVRDSQELTEYLIISLWESMRAIKRFAGDDAIKSVYSPKDYEFLLKLEPTVKHYEVAAKL
jgi:heme-degrading monooxygenase HmoA